MAFTIRWENNNPGPSVVKLYRDTKPLVNSALPEPIATFNAGESEYVDRTAILGTTYYYMTTVTVGSRTLFSPQKTVLIQNRRGVGSSTPTAGDDRFAYYGTVPFEEQPPYGILPAGLQAIMNTDPNTRLGMHKFQLDGKILYITTSIRMGGVWSWETLYNAGLVYGVDGPGPEGGYGDLEPVNQSGLFEHLGDRYRVRLMRGLTTDDQSPAFELDPQWNGKPHDDTPYTAESEWNRLGYGISFWFPAKKKVMSLLKYTSPTLLGYGVAYNGGGSLCQEFDPVRKVVLMRGTAITASDDIAINMQTVRHTAPSSSVGSWIPVIELVEE